MVSRAALIGMSIGNEPGDVVSEFLFPLGIPRFFSLGQGGVGKEATMSTVSFHAFLDDQWWIQFAPNTGVTNNSWSNGWQQFEFANRRRNFVLVVFEAERACHPAASGRRIA